MKLLFVLIGVAFAISGCASSPSTSEQDWQKYYSSRSPSSVVSTHACIPKIGPDCKSKIRWICPNGFVDDCNTPGSTGKHECVARGGDVDCATQIAAVCPQNFVDGCFNGSAEYHTCMPKIGAPCSAGTPFVCPSGFKDACDDVPMPGGE
jgi:hypothetical protein